MTKRKRFTERIGEKHNSLTIVSVDGKTECGKYAVGTVDCDCGGTFSVRLADVVSGNSKSCGCGKRSFPNKAIARSYTSYSWNATQRNYNFDLTHEEFTSIVKSNCHYCGIEPSREASYKGEDDLLNGVDRVDNDKGYSIDNVVPCCSICNQAKHAMKYDDFMSWVKRLVEWHK